MLQPAGMTEAVALAMRVVAVVTSAVMAVKTATTVPPMAKENFQTAALAYLRAAMAR